jgi:predicted ATPase
MADGGEGLGQVLPIIVALSMARQDGVMGRILAIEEPESHLHSTHHEALMNELVRTATAPTCATVVVETHSQEFLLSALLAIADGRIRAGDVIVHYVYKDTTPFATINPVLGVSRLVSEIFDDKGRPLRSALPPDIFTSDVELLQRLFAVQLGG